MSLPVRCPQTLLTPCPFPEAEQPAWEWAPGQKPVRGPRVGEGPYLLGGAGDNALLKAVGLLLEVLPGLVVPEQVVLYLEVKQVSLENRARRAERSRTRGRGPGPDPRPHPHPPAP